MSSNSKPAPLMVLGTSSGAGKSLMTAALCRVLLRKGEIPLPFKGQNMSNNAWVDEHGGEMAYSQALQAWASGIEPHSNMNPVLLKPKGDCTSEVIHLGKKVGIAMAETYYQEWFSSGWAAICKGLNSLRESYKQGRLVLEGAGSPAEVNLQHRDLTNLRLAKFLKAKCILVADIERGGVFAQLIGTLALMSPVERKLIKGLLINRFRGRSQLFDDGRHWLEQNTGIPVLGVMPFINEAFPPEDSLDLLQRKAKKNNADIEIAVIKFLSISNFSDLDPLEAEPSVNLRWVEPGECLGNPDVVILPGSKQTIRDLQKLKCTGLDNQLKDFAENGGDIFGICGGMQILGSSLEDPYGNEDLEQPNMMKYFSGLDLLPIHTVFENKKILARRHLDSLWPSKTEVLGFEVHYGHSKILTNSKIKLEPMMEDSDLGWVNKIGELNNIAGTYLHGIFDNGAWRRLWLNQIRRKKGLQDLPLNQSHHSKKRESLIDLLADHFEEHIAINPLLLE